MEITFMEITVQITRWFIVLVYLIPIVGTLVLMGRRTRSAWSFGRGIRKRLPDNPVSRTLKRWSDVIRSWWGRQALGRRLSVRRVNVELGRVEYMFGHLRDYTFGVLMLAGAVFNLTMCLLVSRENIPNYFFDAFYCGIFAGLSLATYRRHVSTGLKMTEFMRVNPWVHPQEFFDHYYRCLGPLTEPIPELAETNINPEDVSYLTDHEARTGYERLLYGFYDTAIFARSAYKVLDTIGEAYGREVFDVMASLWGSRMLQLFRSRLKVTGADKFKELDGKVILVFNHKSHLDFVLNFFALSKTHLRNGRRIRPRYMAAKDHFVDNKIIYDGIGVGHLIESVDMIFVDRKGEGADAIAQAAQVLVEKDVEIAMYPQGTRAYGNLGLNRERHDAGFYTTGSAKRLKEELGHLKKGVAYLALDTALELQRREKKVLVHLVFIGIEGTANLVPKGSFKLRTECEVSFQVGDILTVRPDEVKGLVRPQPDQPLGKGEQGYREEVAHIMRAVNDGLVNALNLHRRLTDRFVADVRERKLAPSDKWLIVKKHLIESDQKGFLLPFQIIDRIYALDPSYWTAHLRQVAEILSAETLMTERLQQLNSGVVDFLFQTRGKLMKTAVASEMAQKKQASKKAI